VEKDLPRSVKIKCYNGYMSEKKDKQKKSPTFEEILKTLLDIKPPKKKDKPKKK
jgi:hypothetical protein